MENTQSVPTPIEEVKPEELPTQTSNEQPTSSHAFFWKTAAIVFFVLLLISLGSFYYLNLKISEISKAKGEQANKSTISETGTQDGKGLTANLSSPKATPAVATIPQQNTVYYGTYNSVSAFFVTNDKVNGSYNQEGQQDKTYTGTGITAGSDNLNNQRFTDFRELKEPRAVISYLSQPAEDFTSALYNATTQTAYLALITGEDITNEINSIYRINLKDFTSNRVWTNKINDGSNKYGKYGGAAYLADASSDPYLVLDLINCYHCSPSPDNGVVILNTNTKAEKFMELIGNVTIEPTSGKFTYQRLATVKEPCPPESGMGCDENNVRTLYKSAGEVLTDTLP